MAAMNEESNMTLQYINLDVPASKITTVVGPVASGKSTSCKVLLGETPRTQGQILMNYNKLSRKIGYCDQYPYLAKTSIKNT